MILPQCTIVIPTRNRPKELQETAHLLCANGLCETPVIVVDDASDNPDATDAAVSELAGCRIIKQNKRTGQAGARNSGMKAAETRYVLLLDDDCHIDNPEALVSFLQAPMEPNTAIWRFPTIRQYDGNRMKIPQSLPRTRLSNFVGFGALLHVERILTLGGFRSSFIYRAEEADLGIRVFRAGWEITYVPDAEFIHRHVLHSQRGMVFNREYEMLTSRNVILYHGLNFPFPLGPIVGLLRAAKISAVGPQGSRAYRLLGLFNGIVTLCRKWHSRTPLTWRQWRKWIDLNRQVARILEQYNTAP